MTRKTRPVFLLGFASTALIAVFLSLGFWQLERAEIRRAADAQQQERAQLSPVYITSFPQDSLADLDGRRLRLRGRYLPQQFLLDNQILQNRPGYHVLSPFALSTYQQVILINRGWVPAPPVRDQLPDAPIPTEAEIQIDGTLTLPQRNPFTDPDYLMEGRGWPLRIQDIDYARLAERLGELALIPATVRLHPGQLHGYVRDWPQPPMSAAKHDGYAVQWFAMAGAVLILFLLYFARHRRDD